MSPCEIRFDIINLQDRKMCQVRSRNPRVWVTFFLSPSAIFSTHIPPARSHYRIMRSIIKRILQFVCSLAILTRYKFERLGDRRQGILWNQPNQISSQNGTQRGNRPKHCSYKTCLAKSPLHWTGRIFIWVKDTSLSGDPLTGIRLNFKFSQLYRSGFESPKSDDAHLHFLWDLCRDMGVLFRG